MQSIKKGMLNLERLRCGKQNKMKTIRITLAEIIAIKNHDDKKTNEMCKASKLDCEVFCDGGGYMYLLIY